LPSLGIAALWLLERMKGVHVRSVSRKVRLWAAGALVVVLFANLGFHRYLLQKPDTSLFQPLAVGASWIRGNFRDNPAPAAQEKLTEAALTEYAYWAAVDAYHLRANGMLDSDKAMSRLTAFSDMEYPFAPIRFRYAAAYGAACEYLALDMPKKAEEAAMRATAIAAHLDDALVADSKRLLAWIYLCDRNGTLDADSNRRAERALEILSPPASDEDLRVSANAYSLRGDFSRSASLYQALADRPNITAALRANYLHGVAVNRLSQVFVRTLFNCRTPYNSTACNIFLLPMVKKYAI
jgi:hypothetical protein